MWQVQTFNNNTSPQEGASFSDGEPIDAVRGPEGACFRFMVYGSGYIDFPDTGHQTGGPAYWHIVINGELYWYEGQGELTLTVNNDKTWTITGNGNNIQGTLTPFPQVSERDAANLSWMIENKYVPYQNIPDAPGKTFEEIKALGEQYFPFTPYSFEVAMAVYDWTSPSFARIDFFRMFEYTGVAGTPLDMDSIANSIWTSNWPPFTPQDPDYMNSFMMVPADSLANVQAQLAEVAPQLHPLNTSQINLIMNGLNAMPPSSVYSKPRLYSGQVDVSNLGTQHFATYFTQLPYNWEEGTPLEMPLEEAIDTFMQVGKTITLKGVMSFTDSLEDAMKYSNGIVLNVAPPTGALTWTDNTYITPLSDDPAKTEYLFKAGAAFKVLGIEKQNENGSEVTVFYLEATN